MQQTKIQRPTVIILEDDELWISLYRRGIQGKAKLLYALDTLNFDDLFKTNPDTKIITVDANTGTNISYTIYLVEQLRVNGFAGPIIAAATMEYDRQELLKAGCSHECEKGTLPDLLVSWIDDPAKMAEAWAQSGKLVLGRFASPAKAETAPNPG